MKNFIKNLYREWRIYRMQIDDIALCIDPHGDIFIEVLIDGEWIKAQSGIAERVSSTRTLISRELLFERRYEQKDSN